MRRMLNKKNILLFTRTMGQGGTENVVLQLCEILKPLANKVIVCSCGGVSESKLKEMGIKHYTIPDITEKSPKTMMTIAKQLKQIVKNEYITVIHSHHRMAAFYTEVLFGEGIFKSGRNVIKIANAHNTFTDKGKLTRFAYRNMHMIAVGEKVKENLVDYYGLSEHKVTVIHNAIKSFEGTITPIEELDKARKAGYTLVGNIGRLSEQKGMTYFIQAAAKVLRTCPKTKFYVVGSGELEVELKEEVEKWLLPKSLFFLGYRFDVQNVMSQLDFVVLSSLWEGFPLTPIEAFSVGKAVVATAVDGTPEIVEDKKNGLLVKSKDVDCLARAMIEMIENEDKRILFGKNAYKRYIDEFSFEKMAERYVQYYERLCGEMYEQR